MYFRVFHKATGNEVEPFHGTEAELWEEIAMGTELTVEEARATYRIEPAQWPTAEDPCHDCGSIHPNRHTPLCDFADPTDRKDLPMVAGTHWWDKSKPLPE